MLLYQPQNGGGNQRGFRLTVRFLGVKQIRKTFDLQKKQRQLGMHSIRPINLFFVRFQLDFVKPGGYMLQLSGFQRQIDGKIVSRKQSEQILFAVNFRNLFSVQILRVKEQTPDEK